MMPAPLRSNLGQAGALTGACLCGAVAFEIEVRQLKLYRCHCSLCRRQSGGTSNCAAVVDARHFRWIRGQDGVSSWTRSTGYRSDFCSRCGSPVPNPLRGLGYYSIPAGLLEDAPGRVEIVADVHLASRISWDDSTPHGLAFDDLPALDVVLPVLHAD